MRLYSRAGAQAVDAPEGHFEPAEDGGFDLPGPLADRLHTIAVDGEMQWETSIERQHRLIAEEAARRADPATLLGAVEQLVAAAQATAAAPAKPAPAKPAPAKSTTARRTTAK